MSQEIAEFNAGTLQQWGAEMVRNNHRVVMAISMNGEGKLCLYTIPQLEPKKIAEQLRDIARQMDKASPIRIVKG